MSIIDLYNENPEFAKALDELEENHQEDIRLHPENFSNDKESPMEITIKPEALDTSTLEEGEGSKQYRPKILENYIGQQEAKELIEDEIKGCQENNEPFPHTFLSAPAGHGKTLLAEIIAKKLNKTVVMTTGGQLKSQQQFIDKITECNGGIIVIDEANRIKKEVGFFMLPTIEKFEVDGKKLKSFTVIFCTTHKGELSKDLDALIQRCDLELELNHYSNEELITIIKQYKNKQYPNKEVSNEIYLKVAENCKRTPRKARTLLRKYIFCRDWDKVLKNNKIIKDGLVEQDIKVLKYLNKFEKGLGKNSIANYLRIKPITYEYEIEPYLIYKELVIVSSRRKITDEGKELLKGVL